MNPLFSTIGVLHVDHYAVTTLNLEKTLRDFLSIPGSKLLRGPGENPAQGVYYAFVELNGMGTVEILSPLNDKSPILSHIKQGSGAYHLCYAVADIEVAVAKAQESNAKLVVEPRADGAFDGRRVAFLIHPDHGLFEVLEAYPASFERLSPVIISVNSNEAKASGQVLTVYNQVMETNYSDMGEVSMKVCAEWDSFKHLLLIMEIEKQFEISIPASQMSELDDLTKINRYIDSKLK
ncbi:VOC family protein [Vibrio sp. F74]|uniref:VOC family protein n=1 Tax=Vibrio sp. F74 TaxID=700020 RepID=UPI0035F54561